MIRALLISILIVLIVTAMLIIKALSDSGKGI